MVEVQVEGGRPGLAQVIQGQEDYAKHDHHDAVRIPIEEYAVDQRVLGQVGVGLLIPREVDNVGPQQKPQRLVLDAVGQAAKYLKRKFMSCTHFQKLGQLADLASDLLFTLVNQEPASLLTMTTTHKFPSLVENCLLGR